MEERREGVEDFNVGDWREEYTLRQACMEVERILRPKENSLGDTVEVLCDELRSNPDCPSSSLLGLGIRDLGKREVQASLLGVFPQVGEEEGSFFCLFSYLLTEEEILQLQDLDKSNIYKLKIYTKEILNGRENLLPLSKRYQKRILKHTYQPAGDRESMNILECIFKGKSYYYILIPYKISPEEWA